jgi:hypothetical protein
MRNATSLTNRNDSVEKFEDHKQAHSKREQTIKWLQTHNYPALPVAPVQSAGGYHKIVHSKPDQGIWQHCPLTADLQPIPLYTGKNPSYLDESGTPHLVNHSDFQKRLPNDQELKTWFANPANGVGTLGGWNNTVWLDFDLKQFENKEQCTAVAFQVADCIQQQTGLDAFLEQSHSGGWRVGVRVRVTPNFTNFALEQGGKHFGEALGQGRFTVLAPTIGPSGNPYESFNRVEPPLVDSLESIGIYSTKAPEPAYAPTKPERKRPNKSGSNTFCTISLEDLGHEQSQNILIGANHKGDRSFTLATAIQEWYGWQNWCNSNGVYYSGSTAELAHIAGTALGMTSDRVDRILNPQKAFVPEQCQPAALLKGGESSCWKKIYRLDRASFSAKCPAHIKAAIKEEWRRTQDSEREGQGIDGARLRSGGGQESRNGGNGTNNSKTQHDAVSLPTRVREIISRYDSESLQTAALMNLGDTYAKPYSDIEKLARVVRLEDELTKEASDTIIPLRALLKTCRKRLNLHRYLDSTLADALIAAAKAMPTAPEYLLNTLIPAFASCIGVSSRIVIKAESHYIQPCIFWSANVADSGQAKTPPQALIMEALKDMEQQAREAYSKQLADWEASSDKNKGAKPIETRRILNNTTMAQKIRIHAENPHGLIEYIDELTGDFERHNQHSGGKGDDLRQELGIWNGEFGAYDRGDVRLYLRRTGISKTGTYQWDLLAQLMADQVNFISSGYLARFLLCSIPDAPDRKLDLLSPHQETGLKELLGSLYHRLEQLPERDYLLSDEAKVLFQGFNHVIVELDKEEPHFGMGLVYAKIESYAARLALWLHIVNAVVRSEVPGPVINGETMQAAIELASFYLWQHKLIHAHNSPSQKLEGILLKAQTCAEKLWAKGKALTASFAKSRINRLKSWAVDKIRERVFRVLASGGFGRLEGVGENLVYIPNTVTPFSPCDNTFTIGDFGGLGGELVVSPTDGITIEQAIQTSVGALGESVNTVDSVSEALTQISTRETTNFTNLAVETVELTHLEPVGETPTPSPTLGDDPESWGSFGSWGAGGASSSSPEEVKSRGTEQKLVEQGSVALSENLSPSFSSSPASPALFNDDDPSPPGGGALAPPTLQELTAMLLACESLTKYKVIVHQYGELAVEAYRVMSVEQQLVVDGLTANQYNEPIYKYLGEWRMRNGQTLRHGDLVRLMSGKRHLLVGVLPLECPLGEEQQRVIDVNPRHLVKVHRREAPPQGQQLSLT